MLAVDPHGIGLHRDRRLDDGDRIAMRDGDEGIREHGLEHRQLLQVLRAFEHPSSRPVPLLQQLQHGLHILIM